MTSENSKLKEPFDGFKEVVESVGPVLRPGDLDSYFKIQDFQIKSYHLRTVLDAWKEQQEQDRQTRKYYARWLLIVVFVQIALINSFFILIGLDILKVNEWTSNTFIISVFAEISAMVLIVVNYLFPKPKEPTATLIEVFKEGRSK